MSEKEKIYKIFDKETKIWLIVSKEEYRTVFFLNYYK